MTGIEAIRTQVEFYFGLDNLLQDAFLISRMNSRMMVPLSMILSFRKIRMLSTNFDEVLEAVQESRDKLVVERDPSDGEWWIGPQPQAAPESQCTIVLTDVADDVTVEDIEALAEAPLIHSYNFADGTWNATYQDRHAAKAALLSMSGKLLKGTPVKARLKTASSTPQASTHTTLNRNATPYQVPHRQPRTPNNTPNATPSLRSGQWQGQGNRPNPVAGCPLYVSRSPVPAPQRPIPSGANSEGSKRVNNAILSTFCSMPPVQQQLFMMNFMMQHQMLMQGARMDAGNDNGVPPFQLNGGGQRPNGHRSKRFESHTNAAHAESNPSNRKGRGGFQNNSGANGTDNADAGQTRPKPRMEALGADLPDVCSDLQSAVDAQPQQSTSVDVAPIASTHPSDNAKVSHPKKSAQVDHSLPLPALNNANFPTLGGDSAPAENAPLTGWAAALAKAKPAKADIVSVESNTVVGEKGKEKKQKKAAASQVKEPAKKESATPSTSTAGVTESNTPTSAGESSVTLPAQHRSYASLLAKSA